MKEWVQGEVVAQTHWTGQLHTLKVEADIAPFHAGQYTRLAFVLDGATAGWPYSFVNAPAVRPHEFHYVVLPEQQHTRRLSALVPGETIYVAAQAAGALTLDKVAAGEQLWLFAGGTAISPFLSILGTEAPWMRFKRVVLVHAVRYAEELSYREWLRALQVRHGLQFTFLPVLSREASDDALAGRIPEAIADGRMEARVGLRLEAQLARAMICGNPAMVADTVHALERRGLKQHRDRHPGQISLENYW